MASVSVSSAHGFDIKSVVNTHMAESALQLPCIVPAVSNPHINMSFFPPFKFMRAGAEFCYEPENESTFCICSNA